MIMDISVIIPLYNEEESLGELAEWIHKVMTENHFSYEIIFIDDGSRDNSLSVLKKLASENPNIRAISFRRNYGKSAALNEGFKACSGNVVITMDSDLQDSPDEIPELYDMIINSGYDLVSGWKKKRYDPLTKTIPTKLYNAAIRKLTRINLHDSNCGLKAYKSDVIKTIEVYGEMHRYIPVIAKWNGFFRIGEKIVQHRPRKYGATKFGLERFTNGMLDLSTILFVSKFGKRPMHFFGTMGIISFFSGFIMAAWIIIEKFIAIANHVKIHRQIVDKPVFYIALVMVIIGVFLFLGGFLGELISRNSSERNIYNIRERINL
jgi:glycosyltransferase involved in cell wall biosynthesis